MVKEMKEEVVSLSWENEAFCMKISAEKNPLLYFQLLTSFESY